MFTTLFLHCQYSFIGFLLSEMNRVLQCNAGDLCTRRKQFFTEFNLVSLFLQIPQIRCFVIRSDPCLGLSLLMTHTLVVQSLFLSDNRISFTELPIFSLSSLDPYSDHVGIKISLQTLLFSFLKFILHLFALLIRKLDSTSFSPSTLPSSGSFFILRDFNFRQLFVTQEVL